MTLSRAALVARRGVGRPLVDDRGLGRVKTHDFGGAAVWLGGRMRANDYVLIAARSGWTPIMFMTRVKL
jgi:hypothetical protein